MCFFSVCQYVRQRLFVDWSFFDVVTRCKRPLELVRMVWLPAVLLVALASTCARAQQRETCYANDVDPYVKFATKTAYEFVNEKTNTQQHIIPNCEPIMFWSLNRHGARLPNPTNMMELPRLENFKRNVLENYNSGSVARNSNVRICRADLMNLEHWRWMPNHNMSFAGDLTSQGYMDTQNIARTWRSKFPNIMTNDPNDYLFKYVDDRRNKNSYQAYTEGIFGQRAQHISIPHESDEAKLRPLKHCPTWTKAVERNNDTLAQVNIFISKEEFKTMVANVSSRLGFAYLINNKDVEHMYEMCRLNKAWDITQPSAWCAAFTRDELKRLEYIEDLKSYYTTGYGSPLNAKIGCGPVKDMVNFFGKYVNSPFTPPQPKASIQFTDSAMLLLTLTAMGAYQDTIPLTGDNFHTPLIENRKWRTSDIDPFSANIVAVLYRCRDNGEQFRVMFFLNERPMMLNGCAVGLCDWSWVKSTYGHVADKCDLKFCNSGSAVKHISLLLVVSAFLGAVINVY